MRIEPHVNFEIIHGFSLISWIAVKIMPASLFLDAQKFEILQIMFCSNFIVQKLFLFVYYGFNFGIAWDLTKSMSNPFDSVKERYKTILMISAFNGILFIVL